MISLLIALTALACTCLAAPAPRSVAPTDYHIIWAGLNHTNGLVGVDGHPELLADGAEAYAAPGGRIFDLYWNIPAGPEGHITCSNTNKCMDAGSHPTAGTRLKVWECMDVPQQQWRIHDNKVELVGFNLCWDLHNLTESRFIQTTPCSDDNPGQIFDVVWPWVPPAK